MGEKEIDKKLKKMYFLSHLIAQVGLDLLLLLQPLGAGASRVLSRGASPGKLGPVPGLCQAAPATRALVLALDIAAAAFSSPRQLLNIS